MATLQNCASLFQLGFGVNAIVPALYFTFRRTQESLASRLSQEIQKTNPEFYKLEREKEILHRFVFEWVPFVKLSYRLRNIPALFLTLGLISSFFGLVFSAIQPNHELPNSWVWLFSIYALLFCPSTYLLYGMLLKGLERLWVWKWSTDPSSAKRVVESFQLHRDHIEFMERDDVRSALLHAQMAQAERARREIQEWVAGSKARALSFVPFLKWLNRSGRTRE